MGPIGFEFVRVSDLSLSCLSFCCLLSQFGLLAEQESLREQWKQIFQYGHSPDYFEQNSVFVLAVVPLYSYGAVIQILVEGLL